MNTNGVARKHTPTRATPGCNTSLAAEAHRWTQIYPSDCKRCLPRPAHVGGFFLCVFASLRDNRHGLIHQGAAMPEDRTESEPAKRFLAYILQQHQELRGKDVQPETLEEWARHKELLRRKLHDSWGGFPREPCELAP